MYLTSLRDGLTALFFLRSRMRDFIFMITRTRHFVCARVIKSVRVIKIIQNESLGGANISSSNSSSSSCCCCCNCSSSCWCSCSCMASPSYPRRMKLQKVSGRRSMQIIVSVISTEAFFSLIKSVGQRVVCSCSPSFCDAFDRCADLVLLFFWWAFRLTFRSHWFTNTTKKIKNTGRGLVLQFPGRWGPWALWGP